MASRFTAVVFLAIVLCFAAPTSTAQEVMSQVQKQQERYTVSLALEFSRKQGNSLEATLSALFGILPNGYATGFLVRDGLVLTAYHVVRAISAMQKKSIWDLSRETSSM